ncbi:MAG: hypothetical protein K0V04_00235 [Deltaproteobacteria bacterium]|nr:hypothetical protein [Deltaproteobacteria bacterium]
MPAFAWSRPRSLLLLSIAVMAGCPSANSNPFGNKTKQAAPQAGADDPRVAVKDGELYTHKTIDRAAEKTRGGDDQPTLGSGRPDETNGVCRLYAPKLPHPQCCKAELGFDVETAQKACGHELYLGESFRMSCGFYFHHDEAPRWFRLANIPETTTKEAVEHHDRKMTATLQEKYTPSVPIPGVEDAYWSRHDEFRWAFLPGWNKVRQLSWHADSCSDEGVITLIKQIVAAKPPPKNARRLGLVPKARM